MGRARKLNIDAERNARHELERGAKARKALVEMVHEARRETREAKTAVKETSERAQMLEEWAKRRDAAANAVATRLRRSLQDCAALARRVKVITEENVKLRRRAARDRADLFDANEYSERLEADWISRAAKKSTEGDDDEDEPGIDFRGLKQLVSMGLGTLSGDITEINLDDPKRTVVMELGACVARRDVGFD